jgi:sterol desaturase/sphingolipid hydroxylase (fatty acid hydroxylase superfamily)
MEDLVTGALLLAYATLIALDFLKPARHFPRMRFWRLKGFAFFLVNVALFTALPFVWDEHLAKYRLFDATGLGMLGGAALGLLLQQLISYTWHRSMHNSPFLFRWFHQMHHSSERMDIWSAMIFSPLDVVGFALTGSLALALVAGVTPEAAVLTSAIATFGALFTHANLRTPQWLGYIIHRPENHSLHHERGVHAYNYGDFPFWDLLFGTFKNPKTWEGEAGYYDGASNRIGAMLIGRDVTEAPEPKVITPAARESTPLAA